MKELIGRSAASKYISEKLCKPYSSNSLRYDERKGAGLQSRKSGVHRIYLCSDIDKWLSTEYIDNKKPVGGHVDLTGRVYSKLTVKKRVESKNGKVFWLCECECGAETRVVTASLNNGQTRSCGCLRSSNNRKDSDILPVGFDDVTEDFI